MRIAFITRSTIYDAPGGDTVHITETVNELMKIGVEARICLTNSPIDHKAYDLFHFFNITRPADILYHLDRIKVPSVLSPIFIDYSEYDRGHRNGFSGTMLRSFPADTNEYIKTISRTVKGTDVLQSRRYLWKGQRQSVQEVLERIDLLLPNSFLEYQALRDRYGTQKGYTIVPNGINTSVFSPGGTQKEDDLIICAARIEGIKNQLNLIQAMNNSRFRLIIIGAAAPNQQEYYTRCRKLAASNITFAGRVSQEELAGYYARANVHVLPSWFETCGLSSLEAAAMGCKIVITNKGYTREYFEDLAFYCDPGKPHSLLKAIEAAAEAPTPANLQENIRANYTWEKAATSTLEAYKKVVVP